MAEAQILADAPPAEQQRAHEQHEVHSLDKAEAQTLADEQLAAQALAL
jgi:hypothetical protein